MSILTCGDTIMAIDIEKLFAELQAELPDLQKAYTDRAAKQTALDAAQAAQTAQAAAGVAKIADLQAKHAEELTALQAQVDADGKAANDALTAAVVASQVANQLCDAEMAYVVSLVHGDDSGPDPTPNSSTGG